MTAHHHHAEAVEEAALPAPRDASTDGAARIEVTSTSSDMSEARQELRRIALEHLNKSMLLADEAARADSVSEEGVDVSDAERSTAQIFLEAKGDDDLPDAIFDLDRIVDNMPLLRGDNAFFETMNSDDTISCPFVFYKPWKERAGIEAVVRFGKSTAGHPKTVHGGVTAMTFDNLMGTALFMHGTFPVFTAYLKVDYKAMLPCMTTTVVDVTVDRIEGRKLFVAGRLKSLDGKVLYATAEALFIKPKKEPHEAAGTAAAGEQKDA